MKCEKCNKKIEPEGAPFCFSCMMDESDKETKLNELKYPELVKIWEDLGFGLEIEFGEYGHYEDFAYLTDKSGCSIENFEPEDLVKLYEKLMK